MSVEHAPSGARQTWPETGEAAWTFARELAQPGRGANVDETLRRMFRDCPVPPHLLQFVRDLRGPEPDPHGR
ncbi:hypothetical protein [Phenylobacterium sp.]|jgi:hypothetical protein|uniref:hypothetical protein n=1 Tax=Phenylobacterium sp. TaxID=1871053 RepID=UPI002F3FAE4A